MKRLPSGVQKYTPSARATAIGATFFCAVHSKIVCVFDSATISSLVMDIGLTSTSAVVTSAIGLSSNVIVRHE